MYHAAMRIDDPLVKIEVLKLMLQAAWADGEIHELESAAILGAAERLDLPAPDLDALAAHLRGTARLPPPNLGLLKLHKEEVLAVMASLFAADHKMVADEAEVLAEIEALLS
jgi:uncharacterized tellurite resistance protein B-like protein